MWNHPCFFSLHPPHLWSYTINHCQSSNSNHLTSQALGIHSQSLSLFVFRSTSNTSMLYTTTYMILSTFWNFFHNLLLSNRWGVFGANMAATENWFHPGVYPLLLQLWPVTEPRLSQYSVCICFHWVVFPAVHMQCCRNNSRHFNNCSLIYILHYPWLDSYALCILCSSPCLVVHVCILSHHCSPPSLRHVIAGSSSCRYCC